MMKKIGLLMFVFVFLISLSSAALTDDLQIYWTMNETTGAIQDSTGNGNLGQVTGATSTGGILNNSYNFTATSNARINGSLDVTSFASFKELTVSLWVWIEDKPATAQQAIFNQNESGNNGAVILYYNGVNSNTTSILFGNGASSPSAQSNITVTKNNWTHLAFTAINTSDVRLYVNGVMAANDTNNQFGAIDSSIFLGVQDNLNLGFNGSIDEFGYWNRSLSPGEIATLYNNGFANPYPLTNDIKLNSLLNYPEDNTMTINTSFLFNSTSYILNGNISNATLYLWDSTGSEVNVTTNSISGSENQTQYIQFNVSVSSIGDYNWNVYSCAVNYTGSKCNFASDNFTINIKNFVINDFNVSFIQNVYESDLQNFNVSFNYSGGVATPTANLYYDGTKYTGVGTNLGSNNWNFLRSFDIPTGLGNNTLFWELIVGDSYVNTSSSLQDVFLTNISYCSPVGSNVPIINFTYKNETVDQQIVNAFVSSSTWDFWLGSGTVNKTISFSNSTELRNHTFCGTPGHETFNVDLRYSYDNSESQQRTYSPGTLSLSNATTEQVLWLLPTSNGIFVTFQVLSQADQAVSGAIVTLEREGFGVIATETTGGSGTVNIWLNPNFVYTLTVEKEGFSTFTTTQTFPTTEFTVSLGGSTISSNDYIRGITISTYPKVDVLVNNTDYTFNYTIGSSYWALESFGFNIRNSSGTILGSNSSTAVTGGFLDTVINTGNNTFIIFEYYWNINGSYNNQSLAYAVSDGIPGSIDSFFDRLRIYASQGIFGLDSFGISIILFLVILTVSGILSFKFGLTSPLVIVTAAGLIVMLFDIVGVLPRIFGVPFLPTIISFLIIFIAWRYRT